MNYRYIVLTYILGIAAMGPALFALGGIFTGSNLYAGSGWPGIVELFGWLELSAAAGVALAAMTIDRMVDALKAGMRGEG